MDDDLDALLKDLSSTSKPKAQVSVSANVNVNELDSLINNLTGPTEPKATATATAQSGGDDLDNLMMSLSVGGQQPQRQQVQQKPRPAQTNTASADDLDALLGDLSAPLPRSQPQASASVQVNVSKPQQQKQSAAASDSLDDLLTELSTGPKPSASASVSVSASSRSQPKPAASSGDSLDDLLGQLSAGGSTQPSSNLSRGVNVNASVNINSNSSGADLDSLLNNLNSKSTEMGGGMNAMSQGICAKCGKAITGQIVTALGKSFHSEHFTCNTCQKMLGSSTFFDVGGMPQCEQCFKSLSCPRCGYCDQPIVDRYITALGKKWHPEHFICAQCLQPFNNGAFFERDGKPYCETDYYSMYAFRCASCNEVIKGECVTAFGVKWHPEHFNCQYCHEAFADGAFFEYQGKPYCELHYHQMSGSLCSGCGKAVGSRSLTALGRKWHPEHFVCAFCMNPLAGASFKEGKGKPYCTVCFGKLFGQ